MLSGTVPDVAGLSRLYRLRLSLADSPTHADRIEFTCLCSSRPCYGLAVLSPLLSTPHHCDAVTVRYRTALHRTETDSHRSIPSPSQAHERRLAVGFGRTATREVRAGTGPPPKLTSVREKPVTDPAVAKGFGGQGRRSAHNGRSQYIKSDNPAYRRLPSLPYRGFPNPPTVRSPGRPDF